jgi:hypothetical protein
MVIGIHLHAFIALAGKNGHAPQCLQQLAVIDLGEVWVASGNNLRVIREVAVDDFSRCGSDFFSGTSRPGISLGCDAACYGFAEAQSLSRVRASDDKEVSNFCRIDGGAQGLSRLPQPRSAHHLHAAPIVPHIGGDFPAGFRYSCHIACHSLWSGTKFNTRPAMVASKRIIVPRTAIPVAVVVDGNKGSASRPNETFGDREIVADLKAC